MTVEEKIKKARDILCHDCGWNGCDNDACPTLRKTVKAIELGLAEGRKELEQWKQEWQDAQIKANEEGFARTTLQIKYSELKKENEELKTQVKSMRMEKGTLVAKLKSYEALWDEQQKVIKEKQAQIKLYSEKVGFWEEQAKLKEAQIEEYDRLTMFDIARTEELEAQIEKMKCCGNCKHYTQKSNYLLGICKNRYNVEGNNICNEWELAE